MLKVMAAPARDQRPTGLLVSRPYSHEKERIVMSFIVLLARVVLQPSWRSLARRKTALYWSSQACGIHTGHLETTHPACRPVS